MTRWGRWMRKKWALGVVVLLLTAGLLMPAPTPALAVNSDLAIGCTILGVLTTPLIFYGLWENLPQNQGKKRWLDGEFYVGGYFGGAIAPSQDFNYQNGIVLNNGRTVTRQGPVTVRNNPFLPSVTGGFKFGYFTHTIPYLGLEVETGVNKSSVRQTTLSVSRPIQGFTRVTIPNDNWVNWNTALHIVGRYGFLKDQEVPFGRLQPYVGIGPGFIVMYDELDSAKNFAIDVMAGVRYMALKNVSLFVEYKYSHQFDVELESHYFYLPDNTVCRGTTTFNYDSHKFVAGVAYHF